MTRVLTFAITAALSLSACAAEPASKPMSATAKTAPALVASASAPAVEANVRAALTSLAPGIAIDRIRPAQIPGLSEVVSNGRVVYVSNDGKLLFQGTLIDVATKQNLSEAATVDIRKAALDSVGAEHRIVFGPADAKHRVTVFTDIDCGYCRKLHNQMADYNKLGIAVEYLFFPRAGVGSESFDKAVSVWCAADRNVALTQAKAEQPLPKKTCNNPITMEFDLGQRVGVDGTPAIYMTDGTQIGGYLEPKAMLDRLNAAQKTAAASKTASTP